MKIKKNRNVIKINHYLIQMKIKKIKKNIKVVKIKYYLIQMKILKIKQNSMVIKIKHYMQMNNKFINNLKKNR